METVIKAVPQMGQQPRRGSWPINNRHGVRRFTEKAEQMATAVDRFIKSALEIIDQPLYEQVVDAGRRNHQAHPRQGTQETANRRIEAAAKAIDTADKLARLALDMPDTPTEQHIITADVSAMAPTRCRKWERDDGEDERHEERGWRRYRP